MTGPSCKYDGTLASKCLRRTLFRDNAKSVQHRTISGIISHVQGDIEPLRGELSRGYSRALSEQGRRKAPGLYFATANESVGWREGVSLRKEDKTMKHTLSSSSAPRGSAGSSSAPFSQSAWSVSITASNPSDVDSSALGVDNTSSTGVNDRATLLSLGADEELATSASLRRFVGRLCKSTP